MAVTGKALTMMMMKRKDAANDENKKISKAAKMRINEMCKTAKQEWQLIGDTSQSKCSYGWNHGCHILADVKAKSRGYCDWCALQVGQEIRIKKNDNILTCVCDNCNIYICNRHFKITDKRVTITE
jgi:hypothetical protein